MINDDEYFMQVALQEAQVAYDTEEIPVGAVIVANNKIICKGYEELIELTGYKKSSIAEYIKTGNIIKRGKFKGYKILK